MKRNEPIKKRVRLVNVSESEIQTLGNIGLVKGNVYDVTAEHPGKYTIYAGDTKWVLNKSRFEVVEDD